jgi:hypothetical protein
LKVGPNGIIIHFCVVFLYSERDALSETLAKHKSLLEQCQQREFEAYMEVKKSAETAENAKLEKAEVSKARLMTIRLQPNIRLLCR